MILFSQFVSISSKVAFVNPDFLITPKKGKNILVVNKKLFLYLQSSYIEMIISYMRKNLCNAIS